MKSLFKSKIFLGSALLLVLIVLLLVVVKPNFIYRLNGLPVQATITQKLADQVVTKKKGIERTRERLAFAICYSTRSGIPQDSVVPFNAKKSMDAILDGLTFGRTMPGFVTNKIFVGEEEYEKYKVGDKVGIYYLTSDSTDIRLQSLVESNPFFAVKF